MKMQVKSYTRNQAIFAVSGLIVAGALLWTLIQVLQTLAHPAQQVAAGAITEMPVRDVETRKQAITRYLAAKYHRHVGSVRQYVDLAFREAAKHPDVRPETLLAMMQKESSLAYKAKSNYGAEGLMQVVRRWHPEKLGRRESLIDPRVNIRVGATILQQYINEKGQLEEALVKYSGNADGYADFVMRETKVLQAI